MKNLTYTRQTIDEIIGSKEVAIAGVSRNPKKFGNVVYKTLLEKGFTVYPINPNAETIDGAKTYPSITELPEKVKNLVILLKPNDVTPVVEQAIQKGIGKIWLQQGSTNKEAIEKAKEANVEMVTNKCILMYANPSGFHKFHARINQFFGKY
ncbi:MAG TPA: CoA-binding protein [Bacteroidales bacterium]